MNINIFGSFNNKHTNKVLIHNYAMIGGKLDQKIYFHILMINDSKKETKKCEKIKKPIE